MNVHAPIENEATDSRKAARSKTRRSPLRHLAWLALPIIGIGVGYLITQSAPPRPAVAQVPVVTVAAPLERDITEWDTFVGRFEASRSVDVRPRVSGQVTELHFTDGQIVKKGDPLFTIDPRPFQAALAEAEASVASAKSELELAQTNLQRALRLIKSNAVSQSEVDRLEAEVKVAKASLAAAEAQVRARSLDVEFTTVRAPIAGRVSDRRVDAGNLVTASSGADGTLLTTINALDPIYFSFTGSEALFLKAKRNGATEGSAVEIRLQDETGYNWKGKLDFIDNGLDRHSGTIRARAVLENADLFLTPGMFGQMRLASHVSTRALLVPDTAVQTDQTQKALLVVDGDGTVAGKPVTLGPVLDGLRVVRSGISPTDRVIISGTQMAFPGTKVQAQEGQIAPVDDPAAPLTTMTLAGEATFAR